MVMTMEEITEDPVTTSMETGNDPSVMTEVIEDKFKDMMIETSKDHQEAVMIEDSLNSEEDSTTEMTEEEMTGTLVEEVVSMKRDQESSEMAFASIANKKAIKLTIVQKLKMAAEIEEEEEVIEVASDTVVEEETLMKEALQ